MQCRCLVDVPFWGLSTLERWLNGWFLLDIPPGMPWYASSNQSVDFPSAVGKKV